MNHHSEGIPGPAAQEHQNRPFWASSWIPSPLSRPSICYAPHLHLSAGRPPPQQLVLDHPVPWELGCFYPAILASRASWLGMTLSPHPNTHAHTLIRTFSLHVALSRERLTQFCMLLHKILKLFPEILNSSKSRGKSIQLSIQGTEPQCLHL